MIFDPVFLISAFLFIASLAVMAWTIKILLSSRRLAQPEPEPLDARALELERLSSETDRIAETVKTLELTHIGALSKLGARLDRIELTIKKIYADFSQRIKQLEEKGKTNGNGPGAAPAQPKSQLEAPPPFKSPPFV